MIRYGLFRAGTMAYAVPLDRLQKILSQQTVYFLPRLPAGIFGVLVNKDQLCPVLDMGIFSAQFESARATEFAVLVESECGSLALPAENTSGIIAEQKGRLVTANKEDPRWNAGTFIYQQTEYVLLNIDCLAIRLTELNLDRSDTCGARRHQ